MVIFFAHWRFVLCAFLCRTFVFGLRAKKLKKINWAFEVLKTYVFKNQILQPWSMKTSRLGLGRAGCLHSSLLTHTHPFNGPLSGSTQMSLCQKGKPIWILLEQETVSGSGISWAICKSAPRSRQITTPAPHYSSFFTGRMPFLPPN